LPGAALVGERTRLQLLGSLATDHQHRQTIVTFLMVFLIQNAQNRDAKAPHLKLDELIRGVKGARTAMVALENCTDEELATFQAEFERLHQRLARMRNTADSHGKSSGRAGR
jgi:low affinity Fe/Cu permease